MSGFVQNNTGFVINMTEFVSNRTGFVLNTIEIGLNMTKYYWKGSINNLICPT